MNSSLHIKVLAVIDTVGFLSLGQDLQSTVEGAVQMCLTVAHVTNDVKNHKIYLQAFTAPGVKFVRVEIEKRSHKKTKLDRYQNMSNKTVVRQMEMAEDRFLLQKMVWVRLSSAPMDILDHKKRDQRRTVTFSL